MLKATQHLQHAGFTFKQGKCYANGGVKPLVVELLVEGKKDDKEAIAFARHMKKLGIHIIIRPLDTAQFWQRVLAYDYDMVAIHWTGTTMPGVEQMGRWSTMACNTKGRLNYPGVHEAAIDTLLVKLVGASTMEDKEAAACAIDRVLQWGAYVVPCGFEPFTHFVYKGTLDFPDHMKAKKLLEKSYWWHKGS